MRPYGSDRLRVLEDGTVELTCRHPKEGWAAGPEKTATRSARVGTAVLWDEGCYEVIGVEADANGVRYRLAPLREDATIGLALTYDRNTERQRETERARMATRGRQRRLANALAFLTGHLPGEVQQRIAHETGASAPFLTIVSALAGYLIASSILWRWISARIAQEPLPPRFLMIVAGLLALDATIRSAVAWIQRRPIGSVAGTLVYAIYYALHPHRQRLVPPMGTRETLPAIEMSENADLSDAVVQWEPFITLLAIEDQRRLERFGYDYRRWGQKTAAAILLIAVVGFVSSFSTVRSTPRLSAVLSLLTALGLALEQIIRFIQLQDGPAPSVLRFVIRPLMGKHLR